MLRECRLALYWMHLFAWREGEGRMPVIEDEPIEDGPIEGGRIEGDSIEDGSKPVDAVALDRRSARSSILSIGAVMVDVVCHVPRLP